jgi:ABC-type bacteriocin/lantibiotic exporter with double-glycine peptidase domain
VLLGQDNDLGAIVPILGLFLFAGYRIMPAANICYNAASTLRYAKPAISAIEASLQERRVPPSHTRAPDSVGPDHRVALRRDIRMEDVYFSYGDDKTPLRIDTIIFPAGQIIGIIGPSGSGKSTLFSLLLGLRAPQKGRILIDGVPLDAGIMRHWHNSIGFVSQRPFFSDESIAANIALGLPEMAHDPKAIEAAARMAHVADFIETLPEGYSASMGEDGGHLSGGQRQRISIARALYHNPDVLFLDEITSALDAASEKAVSDAIRDLGGQKTIFIIAHRPAMMAICDVILKLEAGLPVYFGPAQAALQTGELEKGGADGRCLST